MFAQAISSTSATTTRIATQRPLEPLAQRRHAGAGRLERRKARCRNVDWNCFGSEPARICGCTARSAAVAAASDMPGFSRSMMFSQVMLSSNAMLGQDQRLGLDRQDDVERAPDLDAEEIRRRDADDRDRDAFDRDAARR